MEQEGLKKGIKPVAECFYFPLVGMGNQRDDPTAKVLTILIHHGIGLINIF